MGSKALASRSRSWAELPEAIQLIGLTGVPLVKSGDDLAELIQQALKSSEVALQESDILVVTSKIVSKAEGRWVDLATVVPDERAKQVAEQCAKDPREVMVILGESLELSRVRPSLLIVRHKLGFVCANAGVDHSNARPDGEWRLLLPENPDQSARRLRDELFKQTGLWIGVVISDSHGRAFRMGTVGIAIGAAGLPTLWDWRGRPDLFGNKLQVTEVGFADEIAAAAGLVLGQAAEGIPLVIVRGLKYPPDEQATAANLIRPVALDLYQ